MEVQHFLQEYGAGIPLCIDYYFGVRSHSIVQVKSETTPTWLLAKQTLSLP